MLNVRIIKSSAYSPQMQGKDERSHGTWRGKIKFDLINNNNGDLNWVEYLQQYQHLYNESPHRSLGFLSPFQVYFGRKRNRYRKKPFLGRKKEYEVPEENDNSFQMEESKREELTELERERDSIRQKALDVSNDAAQYMIKGELRRNPPSLYNKGETVLLRILVSMKLVKGKKNSPKNTCEGFIHEADHSVHKYVISYNHPVTLRSKNDWFKVDDEEEEEENDRASRKRNARRTDHDDFPGESAKRAKTNNASLLEVCIDQITSVGKLTGDTVNLYFESLRNNQVFGEGDLQPPTFILRYIDRLKNLHTPNT